MPEKKASPLQCQVAEFLRLRHCFEDSDAATLAELLSLKLREHAPSPFDEGEQQRPWSGVEPGGAMPSRSGLDAAHDYPARLPPLRFLRHLGSKPRPGLRSKPVPTVETKSAEPGKPFKRKHIRPKPLQPWSSLWPFLKSAFSRDNPANRIDLPRLIDDLCANRPLHELPMAAVRAWPQQITVILDASPHLRPVGDDFLSIVAELMAWFPERITLLLIEDAEYPDVIEVRNGQRREHRVMPELSPHAAVLVLSDLGMAHPQRWSRLNWQAWGEQLNRGQRRPVALVPVHPPAWRADVTRHFDCAALDYRHPLQLQAAISTAEPLDDDEQDALLTLLAPMARITPALLRAARIAHPRGLSVSAELTFWARPDFGAAQTFREWQDADLRRKYLGLLEQEPELQALAEKVMLAHEASLPMRRQIEQKQILSAFRSAPLSDRQRQYVQCLLNTIDNMDPLERQFFDNWMAHLDDIKGETARLEEIEPLYRRYYQRLSSSEQKGKEAPMETGQFWLEIAGGLQGQIEVRASNDLSALANQSDAIRIPVQGNAFIRGEVEEPASGSRQLTRDIAPGETLALSEPLSRFTISDAGKVQTFELMDCPPWATGIGRDRYGLFVEVEVIGVPFVMRWIPPGEFLMGSPENEPERDDDEGPQHRVRFEQGFWLAETACTQALWEAVMGNNPSKFKDDPEKPVENVGWKDARRFIETVNRNHPGLELRLPSEAEWEYACRAGTTTRYWFGDEITPEDANYGENNSGTVPVRHYRRNPWGLYQMHGNVWEWCQDEWHGSYEGAPEDGQPWETGDSEAHVCRGGSWYRYGRFLRSASRLIARLDFVVDYFGFRLARGPESSSTAGSGRGSAAGKSEGRATPAAQQRPRRREKR